MLHPKIESILRCPLCRGALDTEHTEDVTTGYACARCGVRYLVRDGVIDFTPSDAQPLRPKTS